MPWPTIKWPNSVSKFQLFEHFFQEEQTTLPRKRAFLRKLQSRSTQQGFSASRPETRIMNDSKEHNQVTIRPAGPADIPGVRDLLAQMPRWDSAHRSMLRDEDLIALNSEGKVIGWLMGNHVSEAWKNVIGYEMADSWLCSYIAWLLVDGSYRSNGVGSRLMEAFRRNSVAAGRDTITASPQSGEDEEKLLSFYSRLGYRRAASGQVHRGPWGPPENVPLPKSEVNSRSSAPDPEAEAIMQEYVRRLGYRQ